MNATYLKQALLLLTLLLPLGTARAEVIVFVHGYLGSAHSWTTSGITAELNKAGWAHVGLPANGDQPKADKSFYTVELPSLAPVTMQAGWLKSIVDEITLKNPEQNLTLVGHSAGGVVSRLMLIQYGEGQVK
ncbi:esterase/lipase family protein, partial [Solemya elarraichensis gill symbiont]